MQVRNAAVLVFALVLGVAGAASAQHEGHDHSGHSHAEPAPSTDAAEPSEEAMAEWMKMMSPGEAHEGFNFYVGEWTFVNKSNWGGMETSEEGTSSAMLMMGGRYLHDSVSSQAMGMPFEGASITGYDNMAGEYFSVWFDNFGTGVMYSRGNKDDGGNVSMTGNMLDPMTGGPVDHRMVTTVTGDDTYTLEMYMGSGDDEERVMEIQYTRVKS